MWAGPIEQLYVLILGLGGAVLLLAVVSVLVYVINAVLSYVLVVLDILVRYSLLDWAAVGVLAVIVGSLYLGPGIWQLGQGCLAMHRAVPPAAPQSFSTPTPSPVLLPANPSRRHTSILLPSLAAYCCNCGSEMEIDDPCRMCGWRP